jgi:proteasome accessory factor A
MLELWGRVLKAVDTEDLSLIDREIDWATKFSLIERYRPSATCR